MTDDGTELMDLLARIKTETSAIFQTLDWGEDEIKQVQARHPEQADRLFHAFSLLTPTVDLLTKTEYCFRSHSRELLQRVVDGQDTRPGTDAELACALSEASQRGPLSTEAMALYVRTWSRAFPDVIAFEPEAITHYDYVASEETVDRLERDLRRALSAPDRQLRRGECVGKHHGKPAPNCPLLP